MFMASKCLFLNWAERLIKYPARTEVVRLAMMHPSSMIALHDRPLLDTSVLPTTVTLFRNQNHREQFLHALEALTELANTIITVINDYKHYNQR